MRVFTVLFIVFGLPKPSSKLLNKYKFYFHCIFISYLLFYVNDFVGLMKKKNVISPRLLRYATIIVILAFYHYTGKPKKCFKGVCPCLL